MKPFKYWLGGAFFPWATIVAMAMLTQAAHAQISDAEKSALRANCRSDFMSHCASESPGSKGALLCLQKNVASLSPGCKAAVSATMPPPAATKAPPPAAAPKPATAVAPPPKPAAPQTSTSLDRACGNDYLAHCASVPPGGKEAVVCLRQHAMELSVPCKEALSAMMSPPPKPAPKAAVRAAPPPAVAPPSVAAPAAVAAGPTPQQLKALRFTCRRDFRAHCRGVPAGGQEAFVCLVRNKPRLSPNCRTSVTDVQQSMSAAPPPAAAAPPQVPAGVIAKIESMPLRERLAIVRVCDRDRAVICPGIPPGGGRLLICLASHPQALSLRCGRALQRTLN